MSNTSKIILGILAGAAAGAILGIIFAPDKGSATRQKIADTSADLAGSLKSKIDEFMGLFNETVATAGEKVRSDGNKDVAPKMQ